MSRASGKLVVKSIPCLNRAEIGLRPTTMSTEACAPDCVMKPGWQTDDAMDTPMAARETEPEPESEPEPEPEPEPKPEPEPVVSHNEALPV